MVKSVNDTYVRPEQCDDCRQFHPRSIHPGRFIPGRFILGRFIQRSIHPAVDSSCGRFISGRFIPIIYYFREHTELTREKPQRTPLPFSTGLGTSLGGISYFLFFYFFYFFFIFICLLFIFFFFFFLYFLNHPLSGYMQR